MNIEQAIEKVNNMRQNDNRNWKSYPREYANQILKDIMPEHDMFITKVSEETYMNNDFIFQDNLHNHWKDLYNTVYKLGPNTIFEVGCGSGQHLCNIQKMLPNISVYGCDINSEQLKFGIDVLKIDTSLYKNIQVLDFTLSTVPQSLGKTYDIVYSHAVLLHLSHQHVIDCLINMLKISNKYVILIENPDDHNYNTMLDKLRETEEHDFSVTYPAMYGSNLYLIEKL